jgi:hypothetical protein
MKFLYTVLLVTAGIAFSVPVEILENGDFETGVLTPWTTNNWVIDSLSPYSGNYCAFDEGNYWIRQDFTPIDVFKVISVTFWHMQPETAIFGIEFYYGPSDYDFDIIYVNDPGWIQHDVTHLLRNTGMLEAMRIWGYAGGGPDPDYNYLDEVSIIWDEDVALERTTFGAIKAMFD